jgi:hypothetical protein
MLSRDFSTIPDLFRNIPAIALTFFDLGLRGALFVGGKRPPYIDLLLKLSLLVPARITAVAFVRFDDGPFARVALFLGSHIRSSRRALKPDC